MCFYYFLRLEIRYGIRRDLLVELELAIERGDTNSSDYILFSIHSFISFCQPELHAI
jgi:hypothetical protein